ncbi:hypothetical protein LSTR_LSTR012185 [Laodelphax striatellus]|uniref:SAM domain-containing protein n=1 Tax=Laodelphax striatellus TaxID=195883 RepID=A0A482WLQ3_LAOST|nr:hypothetical protein LSTR_LSTR012185 [Laodelphax striatellus]
MSSYPKEKRSPIQIKRKSSTTLHGVTLPSFLRRANTYGPGVQFDLTGSNDPVWALEPCEELESYYFTIPEEIEWTTGEVVQWIINVVGLPQYKEAFYVNGINGRKLVRLKPGDFPKMNIKDFEHIKIILKYRRDLFNIREEKYYDSIAFPNREAVRHRYLERKSRPVNSSLTKQQFLMDENLVHECWDKQTVDNDYPLLKYGRINCEGTSPLDRLRIYILNMDLIKKSEELTFLENSE